MSFLALCIIVALLVGGILYLKHKGQKDPFARLVRSVRIHWDGNLGEDRNRQLIQAGIDSEPTRYSLLGRRWRELPGDIQSALIKLRIAADLATTATPPSDEDPRGKEARVDQRSHPAPESQTVPYFDAVRHLTMRLSRSIPLEEWATGIPEKYTFRELERIEFVTSQLPGEAPSRYVAEPLKNLVREIALIELAGELKVEAYEELGDEISWPSEILEAVVSAYLKAWLCNSNPFVLLELADLLAANKYSPEAEEAIQAALKFPEYAQTQKVSPYDLAAQNIAWGRLSPGLVGQEARTVSEGLYSTKAFALVRQEGARLQNSG